MIVWMVGLSGAGKTTIGKKLYELWRQQEANTVFIDGDEIRSIFKFDQNNTDYSIERRRINAERIVELCLWLDKQNINVVCCILCIFPEILRDNRQRFSEYKEVYIKTPLDVLKARDTKGLYSAAMAGDMNNVVGVDIEFPEPQSSDLILDASGDSGTPVDLTNILASKLEILNIESGYEYSYGNKLEYRNTYFYTPYLGTKFLQHWKADRLSAIEFCRNKTVSTSLSGETLIESLYQSALSGDIDERVLLLIKRFEVGKRIYDEYDQELRPLNAENYKTLSLYLLFAELLSLVYCNTKKLNFLNPFIKVLDILVSSKKQLTNSECMQLSKLIEEEQSYINDMIKKFEVNT